MFGSAPAQACSRRRVHGSIGARIQCPEEMQARREQDEWDSNGYRSTVDVYMAQDPGTTRRRDRPPGPRPDGQTAISREIQNMEPEEMPFIGVDPDDLVDAVGELSDASEGPRVSSNLERSTGTP